jgi:hypothetical protein
MNWYFAKNGAQEGPVSTEALRAKIDSGEVAPTDLAWREGLADWMPVSKIPDFTRQPVEAPEPQITTAPPAPSASFSSPAPASYQQPAAVPVAVGGQPVSSGMAVGSLICSILSLICCAPLSIVGVILGHIASARAKRDPSRFGGKGMATAGTVIGYIGLIYTAVVVGFFIHVSAMSEEKRESFEWVPFVSPEQKEQLREQYQKSKAEQEEAQRRRTR